MILHTMMVEATVGMKEMSNAVTTFAVLDAARNFMHHFSRIEG